MSRSYFTTYARDAADFVQHHMTPGGKSIVGHAAAETVAMLRLLSSDLRRNDEEGSAGKLEALAQSLVDNWEVPEAEITRWTAEVKERSMMGPSFDKRRIEVCKLTCGSNFAMYPVEWELNHLAFTLADCTGLREDVLAAVYFGLSIVDNSRSIEARLISRLSSLTHDSEAGSMATRLYELHKNLISQIP